MTHYTYVIVGSGMAADAAIGGIRRRDKDGSILVLGTEPYAPYQRPPLSKKLWMDMRLEDAFLSAHRRPGVQLALGVAVVAIDRRNRTVTTAQGLVIAYEKLLIATGGRARRLAGDATAVYHVGTLDEHVGLYRALAEPREVLVIGGGFIGAEMTAVLSSRDHRVTWVMMEERPFAGFFPEDLAQHVIAEYRRHQVEIVTDLAVSEVARDPKGVRLHDKRGATDLTAHVAVVGIGVVPQDDLGRQAGLGDGPGIPVDQYLQTSDPHIWACGDVARMQRGDLMMHEDHALTQGRLAGENMAGAHKPYEHMPFYYSDLYHFGYEAIGQCQTRLDVIEDWVVPGEEGVIYYLQDNRVQGVLNWNVWDGIPKARSLIVEAGPVTRSDLIGAIRNAEN